MKSTSAMITFFSSVLAAILIFGLPNSLIAQNKAATQSRTAQRPSAPIKKDAQYWFDKGALVSTYGNNEAAVQYFHKAIVLNPDFSRAYFSQGVSYGQLGQYQKAVAQINMALQKEPQNGLYHYGRGRVYLLWGDRQKAMADFRKAADLGNEDAIDYLEYIGEDKL
ncbi:MAG: tetratricopeptide repeat protein [Deltaproteobacteria bacterium]|nr:tetratricopeptide repeat protein [Deltaproteobacteria bacterium]